MRYIIGLFVAFFTLTGGIIVLFQSVKLVAADGMTMMAGTVLIVSFAMMILSVLLVWAVFKARKKMVPLDA